MGTDVDGVLTRSGLLFGSMSLDVWMMILVLVFLAVSLLYVAGLDRLR